VDIILANLGQESQTSGKLHLAVKDGRFKNLRLDLRVPAAIASRKQPTHSTHNGD